ncbi:hypothetical protein [Shewanella halifaxensis]|uniref:hypothetical protein n=1 Tax=Shewanella halifaxensis TaxID=271098 RepID=UPI000D594C86|nr:hypothetical protein [Shewanella halifaxensis]
MEFIPDISQVEKIDFRPYMVECGFDYYMVAAKSSHQRMEVQCVMSALAIEIILKSFNANAAGNQGQLNEIYKFDRSSLPKKSDPHDLVLLADALSPSVSKYLFDEHDLEVIEENRTIFKSSRYVYEQTANTIHYDDIIKLAAKMLCKVIYLYKKQGCADPFIIHTNINELYFADVQQVFWTKVP